MQDSKPVWTIRKGTISRTSGGSALSISVRALPGPAGGDYSNQKMTRKVHHACPSIQNAQFPPLLLSTCWIIHFWVLQSSVHSLSLSKYCAEWSNLIVGLYLGIHEMSPLHVLFIVGFIDWKYHCLLIKPSVRMLNENVIFIDQWLGVWNDQ